MTNAADYVLGTLSSSPSENKLSYSLVPAGMPWLNTQTCSNFTPLQNCGTQKKRLLVPVDILGMTTTPIINASGEVTHCDFSGAKKRLYASNGSSYVQTGCYHFIFLLARTAVCASMQPVPQLWCFYLIKHQCSCAERIRGLNKQFACYGCHFRLEPWQPPSFLIT